MDCGSRNRNEVRWIGYVAKDDVKYGWEGVIWLGRGLVFRSAVMEVERRRVGERAA